MRKLLLHGLIALLLVLGQTALLAHQTDIDAHDGSDDCVVCHLAYSLDAAVPTAQVCVTLTSPVDEQILPTCSSLVSTTPPVARSRAPPAPHT